MLLTLLLLLSLTFGVEEVEKLLVREILKEIPLKKAIVYGKGKKELIVFVNPDCPHCRAEWKKLRKHKKELKIYAFVLPFKRWGEKNLKKAYLIVCSKDKAKKLDEVLMGLYDNRSFKVRRCPLLKEHIEVAKKVGVDGVPFNILPKELVIIRGNSKRLFKILRIKE